MPAPRTKPAAPRRRAVGGTGLKKAEEALLDQETHDKICTLMEECYEFNKRMNDAKKAYEARRKELLTLMQENNQKDYRHTVDKVTYLATLSKSSSRVVDVALLAKKVSKDVFMACVSATIGQVETAAGKNILDEVCKTKEGEENVTVKTEAAP